MVASHGAWRRLRAQSGTLGIYLTTTTSCGETMIHLLSLQPPPPDVPGVDQSEECALRVE